MIVDIFDNRKYLIIHIYTCIYIYIKLLDKDLIRGD